MEVIKCQQCVSTIKELGHRAPEGWRPFAWGPSVENPSHYYVFPEDTPDIDESQELETERLCGRNNWIKRN
jgi:hypothetical protein